MRGGSAARVPVEGQEERVLADFMREYGIRFNDHGQLKLALTHRSYLHVTGQRDSNERLEFLGDSVLGLVTSEHLYKAHPTEHEGQLTKTKSLLVSKAILSRRALAMGLGRFVLMSHSEMESGGRQRLSILADAFEAVIGAIYLDQGFDAARSFIERWLLRDTRSIVADKRHTNYKSHLQEYVQSTYRTHPVYRIRSEMGPDHSKQFMVEVIVGRRTLGEGKGRNKKEAEQAAARDALERVESGPASDRSLKAESRRGDRPPSPPPAQAPPSRAPREPAGAPVGSVVLPEPDAEERDGSRRRRRGRRGGRGRRRPEGGEMPHVPVAESQSAPEPTRRPEPEPERSRLRPPAPVQRPITPRPVVAEPPPPVEVEPLPPAYEEDDFEEVGRPEGPVSEQLAWGPPTPSPRFEAEAPEERAPVFEPAEDASPAPEPDMVATADEELELEETGFAPTPTSPAPPPAAPSAPAAPKPAFGRSARRVRR